MAGREHQGLQIALILFIFLIVGLAVTTYVFYSMADKTSIAATEAKEKASSEKKRGDRYFASYELLKRTIGRSQFSDPDLDGQRKLLQGIGPEAWEEIKSIEADFDTDMALFEKAYTDPKNYRSLAQHLIGVITKRNDELLAALNREDQLKIKLKSDVAAEIAKTKAAIDALDAANKAKNVLVAGFDAERIRFTDGTTRLAGDLDARRQEIKTLQDNSSKRIQDLESQVIRLTQILKDQSGKLHELQQTESFEKPDGRITWVNQTSRLVWINLGSADGLRRQVTFSVFDRDQSNVEKSQSKGSIEVIRVVEDHLAEASITGDTITDPILSGDLIYSPAWKPGRLVRFALIGLIDANGNGRSDRQMVRNLINTNAGQIDAEVTPDGTSSGALTQDTRYLVVGEKPDERSSPAAVRSYSDMVGRADQLGVEQITVGELLDLMGFRGAAKTQPLGGRGAAAAGSSAGGFRERRPPARGASGAY